MHLYLSSYQLGDRSAELTTMVHGEKRIGVIRNALDFSTDVSRLKKGQEEEFFQLESIGLKPEAIDLREYFFDSNPLRELLKELDALWVVGGNTFILRKAFRQSGLDNLLIERLGDKNFVYAGYSAGACIMTPTLKGIHLVDEPDLVPDGYHEENIWDGLAFLSFCIAPHYRSNHPESEQIEKSVEYFISNKIPFVALKDGEVLILEVNSPPDNLIECALLAGTI